MVAIEIPKISYSNGAVARHVAYALDMPYGSHNKKTFKGYEKNGPAIALVAAASTVSAGAALGGWMGGLMIAGGIASGLGALTGNKTLSTLGMGLSLVGGVGSLVEKGLSNAATGEFMNPFSDGFKFSDTNLGAGFSKVKGFFSDATGQTAGSAQAASTPEMFGGKLIDKATELPSTSDIAGSNGDWTGQGNGLLSGAQDKSAIGSGLPINETANNPLTKVTDLSNSGAQNTNVPQAASAPTLSSTPAAPSSTGLLGKLGLNGKDALSIASGMSGAYGQVNDTRANAPVRNAQIRNYSANTAQTEFATQRAKDQIANLNAQQVNLGVSVNPNANLQTAQQGTQQPQASQPAPAKFAVVLNGQVKYLTSEEYTALQQQKAAMQQQPQGLLA